MAANPAGGQAKAQGGGAGKIIGILAGVLLLLVVAFVVTIQRQIAALREMDARYAELSVVPGKDAEDGPYLRGRAALFDAKARHLHGWTDGIDASIRAAKLADLDSVVLFEIEKVRVGEYVLVDRDLKPVAGAKPIEGAFQEVCRVTVIDRRAGVVSARTTLLGREPDRTKYASPGGNVGSLEPAEVVGYVDALPRRPR